MSASGEGAHQLRPPVTTLTAREEEVLALLGEGLTNREAAARLVVSVKTIEAHKEHIRKKLGLLTGREVMVYAIRKSVRDSG